MLKLAIKPGEKIYIGRSTLLIRADTTVTVYIDGEQPILKDREAIDPETAETPLQKLHLLLQEIYLHGQSAQHLVSYRGLAREVEALSEDAARLVRQVEGWLAEGNCFMAIREVARFSRRSDIESDL